MIFIPYRPYGSGGDAGTAGSDRGSVRKMPNRGMQPKTSVEANGVSG